MTLRQSHFVEPVPLVIAREHRLLEGVDVAFEHTRGSAAQLDGLLRGELDLVVTAMDNLFEWTRAGADVRLIAQVERTTPLRLVARSGFGDISALASCRFAVDSATSGFSLVAKAIFSEAGIEVMEIEVGGVRARMEALLAGSADATLLGPPFDVLAEQAGAAVLLDLGDQFPALPGQGLVSRTEITKSPELSDYLRSLATATRVAAEIPDTEGVALMKRSGFGPAASAHWDARPGRLDVNPVGLEFLTEIRRDLGFLRGDTLRALHDTEPLKTAQALPESCATMRTER